MQPSDRQPAALALPVPEYGALVMPALDPAQCLAEGKLITALVDTEYYGVWPRELDFVALEYVLDADLTAWLRHPQFFH